MNSMFDYDKLHDFSNLYKAHICARKGKRNTHEVIAFENDLCHQLCLLQEELKCNSYDISGYYHFTICDPKVREIYALHYRDRVVQHCLCDQLLAPYFENHLIYDNAACRKNKGTHFAMNRMNLFLRKHFHQYGRHGYALKCDIHKFFDSINHEILKEKLARIVQDTRTLQMLFRLIDSYAVADGKGLPMGNQTSQWFALFYLDEIDRLVKEQLRIKHYTRYMDDFVLLHPSKEYLWECKRQIESVLNDNLALKLNPKTQIISISNGIEYIGWRFSIDPQGHIVRRLRTQSKLRMARGVKGLKLDYANGIVDIGGVNQALQSIRNHLSYGDTWLLKAKVVDRTVFVKG